MQKLAYLCMLFIFGKRISQQKKASFSNNGAKETQFGFLDGGNYDEHNSAVIVGISKIFETQNTFSLERYHMTKFFSAIL